MGQGGMAVGIDYGGTKIEAIVLDEAGRELGRRRVPTPRGDYEGSLEAIRGLVEGLEADLGVAPSPAGIGTPGAVGRDGRVNDGNSTWLIGKPLGEDLERVLQRRVRVANDGNCLALSEALDGAGAGHSVVFAAIIGTGVGGGLVIDGKIVPGHSGMTGEWGHSPLPISDPELEFPGPQCFCGRKGCVETWIAGPGLQADFARHANLAPEEGPRAPEIVARAKSGDEVAQRVLALHRGRVARSLAAVVNVIDPDVVVLGGGVSNLEGLVEALDRDIRAHLYSSTTQVKIRRAQFGDSSGVRGAARVAMEGLDAQ
jgi:fructokinase